MFGQSDVVKAAVVADGDGAAGVDFVVAHAEVWGDLVAGGEGFGSGGVGLLRGGAV